MSENIVGIGVAAAILAAAVTVINMMIFMSTLKLYTEMFKQIAQERRPRQSDYPFGSGSKVKVSPR
jgi:hypothetical protein